MKKRFGKSKRGRANRRFGLPYPSKRRSCRIAPPERTSFPTRRSCQSAEVIEYDEYADNHAYNTVGEIIKHNGRYYEIKAAHTSNAAAYPVETTFAYYRLIELSATGTLDDPIPYPETAGSSLMSFPACITATKARYTLQKQICRIAFIRRTRRACGNGKK